MQIIEACINTASGDTRYVLDNGDQHTVFDKVEVVSVGVFLGIGGSTSLSILYGDTAEEFKRLWAEVEK